MHREIRSITISVYRSFYVSRPQLATIGNNLAVGIDEALSEVQRTARLLAEAENYVHIVPLSRFSYGSKLGPLNRQRVIVIGLHKLHTPYLRAQPGPIRITGYPRFGECEELYVLTGSLFNDRDGFLDATGHIVQNGRVLHRGHAVFRMLG